MYLNTTCSLSKLGNLASLHILYLKLGLLQPTFHIHYKCKSFIRKLGSRQVSQQMIASIILVRVSVEFSLRFWEILKTVTRIKFKDHASNHILFHGSCVSIYLISKAPSLYLSVHRKSCLLCYPVFPVILKMHICIHDLEVFLWPLPCFSSHDGAMECKVGPAP